MHALKSRPTYARVVVATPAIALYLALVAILLWLSLARTGGTFVYAQDDPYIHLALARNLADHGVWGISPTEFASASSSPLWTLLLAALWKLGAHAVWVPFALNILFGVVFLGVSASYVGQAFRPANATLCALVVITPLPTLAFIGMEHTLQVLLVVIFAWQASERLAGDRSDWLWPSVVAALMVATRYESLFLVAVVGAILLWKGKLLPAVILGAAAALPVTAFALYSVAHGGLVLPNSVLMKSGPARFATLGSGVEAVVADLLAVLSLYVRPVHLVLTLAAVVGLVLVPAHRLREGTPGVWLTGLFVGTSLLHAALVKLEWFFRYEAYLVAFGIVALAGLACLADTPPDVPTRRRQRAHPAVAVLLTLLGLPLAARALQALAVTPPAVANIYEQQIQMGRFFAAHYPGRAIAVNDIGAVAFIGTSRVLDIVGLASQEVATIKRRSGLTTEALDHVTMAHGVEAVAIYENVFSSILPKGWVKVGEWKIPRNVAVSGDTVSFYGPTPEHASRLRQALVRFAPNLPGGVRWRDATSAGS